MDMPVSTPISFDAPIEGWDAFHSWDNMPPTAALFLDNLIPGAGIVETRGGHQEYVDLGVTGAVETVASYNAAAGSKLLAAASGGIWDITDDTSVIELAAESTYGSDRWQTENFTKADEAGIMVLCNGVDNTQVFNGTTLTAIDTTGTDAGLSLTPDFIGSVTFKGRMYYWKENDSAFYYTQAGSYQGVFEKFELGTFVQQGGNIVMIFTWTQQDAGHGRDDYLVFVFSTGEVLVYQGDDPENAGYFEQVGRYFTGEPLSIRGHTNYGADAILMTKDGYVSMASIIQEGRTSDVPQFSRLIHQAIKDRTRVNSDLYGWEVDLYPREGLCIFNVPLSNDTFEQHVMNTVTEKWCRFKDINVNCMEVHTERLFGGGAAGKVYALLEGTSDQGNPISFDCLYAFNFMDNPGTKKHVVAAQVLTTHSNPQDIQLQAYADFSQPVDLPPLPFPSTLNSAVWSVDPPTPPSTVGSLWDEDYWSDQGKQYTTKGWQNVSAYGYAVALLVRFTKVNESVIWRSSNMRVYMGGAH